MAELTPKQQRFVEEYLKDLNAVRAALASGIDLTEKPSGAYVYFLLDDANRVVYVGKGRDRRMFKHMEDVFAGRGSGTRKDKGLAQIIVSGGSILPVAFCDNLSDDDAFRLERRMIFRLDRPNLLNTTDGQLPVIDREINKLDAMIAMSLTEQQWVDRHGEDHPYRPYVALYWNSIIALRDHYVSRRSAGLPHDVYSSAERLK